jgi:hypothetical protein
MHLLSNDRFIYLIIEYIISNDFSISLEACKIVQHLLPTCLLHTEKLTGLLVMHVIDAFFAIAAKVVYFFLV